MLSTTNKYAEMKVKEWKSYEQQVMLLKERGLKIDDESDAIAWLQTCGYYRLSGYLYAFRVQSSSEFKSGADFDSLKSLYEFDRELRLISLEAIEKIEVAIRAVMAYQLGEVSPIAYKDSDNFLPKALADSTYHVWQQKNEEAIAKSREECIRHYRQQYQEIPIWVVCQIWDFGKMSHLYKMLRLELKVKIADSIHLQGRAKALATWLHTLNHYRNLCAHHQRIWNRNIDVRPSFKEIEHLELWTKSFDGKDENRCFMSLCLIQRLLNIFYPGDSWSSRVVTLLEHFPNYSHVQNYEQVLTLKNLGINPDWKEVWQSL